jgi:hypothetical protein
MYVISLSNHRQIAFVLDNIRYDIPLCTISNNKLVKLKQKKSYPESLNMEIFYYIIIEEGMGGNIPRAIKANVIKEWLRGKSRDQIAKQEGIGAGTVSSIIQECRQNDTEFNLLRQVALELKNHGESIESFAPLVRLREVLKGELSLLPDKNTPTGGITTTIAGGQKHDDGDLKTQQLREEFAFDEKLESLLQGLLVFCFKQKLSIKDFVEVVYELSGTADRFDVPLESLPSYVKELENKVQTLEKEINEKRLEKQEALEDYDVTLESLEEYKANRPLFEENKKLREELADARQERDIYETARK